MGTKKGGASNPSSLIQQTTSTPLAVRDGLCNQRSQKDMDRNLLAPGRKPTNSLTGST